MQTPISDLSINDLTIDQLLEELVQQGGSDLHLAAGQAPYGRFNGTLRPMRAERLSDEVCTRLILSLRNNSQRKQREQTWELDCAYALPNVSRFRVNVYRQRSSTAACLRALGSAIPSLESLGLPPIVEEISRRPRGLVLVTGPTGSGKTTTLYASLNEIVGPTLKVLTVEDPVEYHLQGVNQIPVDHKVGMTFEAGLRAILRHDPDVVMIGEIRDFETARAAIQASLTGHLVLSTLHTNDSASAATRLIDMGVEPFLIASSLAGAMAQRLVRKICSKCRVPYEPDRTKFPRDFSMAPGEQLFRGEGCDHCRKTGYRGRSGLYELLCIDEEIAQMIVARESAPRIIQYGRRTGLRLLREDGWLKVRQGVTSLEEVLTCTAL